MLRAARTSREETTRRRNGRPRRPRDGASAASRPIGMCLRDLDLARRRPWAAMCPRCLKHRQRTMKALAPCSPKLKKPLWQRSSPRRPWRGRRRHRQLFGRVLLLERNWSSGVENVGTRSLRMKLHLELRYGVACGPCHENECSERRPEPTKVVNHHLVQHRRST